MNPLSPSFLWRMCSLLVLAVAISMAVSIRESWAPEPPFNGWIDMVEVEGRVLIVQAVSGTNSTECLKADKTEVAESKTSVRVRVVLRDVCPRRERTLLEKWRDELWPRSYIGTGGVVVVPVTLDRPLGRRKIFDEQGHEVQVCPIAGSRLETIQRCQM
ncbi:hypothetical protein ACQP2T_05375 [Nonomuraea sp. CA-143628]|uniref:hypothetical protein n=1 Tax=Nonomuraea sp. CA-143628 TaxID=3239997 RepID=UPI003D91ED08